MKCAKCGNDFPSGYYFKIDGICHGCYNHLDVDERAAAERRYQQRHAMSSTSFSIEGYRVVECLGVVRGITVRSRSLLGTLGASLQTIVGGDITILTELCERSREEAFEMMLRHAKRIGANAVVGVRYDATSVMNVANEVLCYGTAVVVEPVAAAS